MIVGPWQPTQVVSPAWLIAEPANLAPFGTGVVVSIPKKKWEVVTPDDLETNGTPAMTSANDTQLKAAVDAISVK